MVMQFLCPNGHKIRCPEERAGQAAKCPKCGVRFRVPIPEMSEELVSEEVAPIASEPDEEELAPSPPPAAPPSVVSGGAETDDEIEFLCPNNHLLHGPLELQGKPGQCPQCGSKFRIPSYEEEPEEEEVEDGVRGDIPLDLFGDLSPSVELQSPPPVVPESALTAKQSGGSGMASPVVAPVPSDSASAAEMLRKLWDWKSQGASIEVCYGDNQRLVPERILKQWSSGTHAVFAVCEPNGSYTISAIAYGAISAVIVKGVKKLPE